MKVWLKSVDLLKHTDSQHTENKHWITTSTQGILPKRVSCPSPERASVRFAAWAAAKRIDRSDSAVTTSRTVPASSGGSRTLDKDVG